MDVDNNDIDLIACKFRTMNTNDKDHLISEFKRLSNTQLGTEGCCFYLDLAEWNLNSALWAYYEYETAAAAGNSTNNAMIAPNVASPTSNQSYSGSNQSSYHHHFMRPDEIPEMQFVCDITIGEGESVAPNTNFVKTWRIKNSGTTRWPSGCTLKYVNGYNFSSSSSTFSSLHSSPSSSSSSSSSSASDILLNNQTTATTTNGPSSVEIDLPELEPQETVDVSISLRSPVACGIYQCQYRTYTRVGQPFGDPIWLLLNVEEGGVLGITQQLNSFNAFGAGAAAAAATTTSPTAGGGGVRGVRHFANPIGSDPSEFSNKSQFDQQAHNIDSNNNPAARFRTTSANINNSNNNDEKRPDFYDDMFR